MEKSDNENIESVSVEVLEREEKEERVNEVSEVVKTEEKNEPKQKESKVEKILLIVAIFVIVVALLSTMFAIINMSNSKIIKGRTIEQVDVSKLSKEEAQKILEEIYAAKLKNQIYLTYKEFETTITYEALEVDYQIENAVKEAYGVGRDGNIFKDNTNILKTWFKGRNINLEVTIDSDMINQISQNTNNSIEGAVVQSSYYIEGDKLIITSGKEGVIVDEKQLLEEIHKILDEDTKENPKLEIPVIQAKPEEINIEKIHEEVYKEVKDAYYTQNPFTIHPEEEGIDFDVETAKVLVTEKKDEYEIQLKITKPTKTVKEIGTEAFPDLLVTFSTKYNGRDVNRTTNLRLAANKVNGTVLLPKQEFSYNKTLGERTIQAGYKEAAVFSNGQVVNGIGGGICQISSTLYDAVIMANLKVTTRRNHQFVTSYLPGGKDATVVWGSQDFKFVNTRKYPIRITATVQGGVATIQIWGVKEEVEYDISIETKKVATIAYTTQCIQDPTLPAGQQKVKQPGSNGSKFEAYKVTKLNGQVVSRTLLSKDTYNAKKKIVLVGTGSN